jgi:hypothetical protein
MFTRRVRHETNAFFPTCYRTYEDQITSCLTILSQKMKPDACGYQWPFKIYISVLALVTFSLWR